MIANEEIIDEQVEVKDPEAPASEEPAKPAAPVEDVKSVKEQLAATRARLAEVERSERYWSEKAAKGAPVAEAPKPQADIAGPELLDLLEKEGVAGLKKLGFVSADEVDARVAAGVAAVTAETSVLSEFPDLNNKGSDLYRKTNEILQSDDFRGVEGPGAIRMAAKQAKAALAGTSTRKTDIDSRLAVQSGARDGAGAPAPSRGVTATAEQLEFAAKMGVTPAQLTAELKASAAR